LANLSVSGNASYTGANVSLGSVSNVHITGGVNGYFLQTDGSGNIDWVNGTTTGNGVVGGSNTQVQFNDNGNFGGTANLVYDNTTGITTGKFNGIFNGSFLDQVSVVNANMQSNTANLTFDVLDGPVVYNYNGLTPGGNTSSTPDWQLNLRGNATTTFSSLLDVNQSLILEYNHLITPVSTFYVSARFRRIAIDGVLIPDTAFGANVKYNQSYFIPINSNENFYGTFFIQNSATGRGSQPFIWNYRIRIIKTTVDPFYIIVPLNISFNARNT
jgi:hypothetical protein